MLLHADVLVYRSSGEFIRGPYSAKILNIDYASYKALITTWLTDAPTPTRFEANLPFWSPHMFKNRPSEFWTLNSIEQFDFDPEISDNVFFYSSHSLLQYPCIASIKKLKNDKTANLIVRLPDLTNNDREFVYAKVKDVTFLNPIKKGIPNRFWSYKPFHIMSEENSLPRFTAITQRISD